MSLQSSDITIAVTVFNRRQYLKQAIGSALGQTRPVKVIVVEDAGPDERMEEFVRSEFGSRIEYFRHRQRRGIFGNWNACLDYCATPWLSILHDDDYLDPHFAEAMVELSREIPERGLYFGHTVVVDEQDRPLAAFAEPKPAQPWQEVRLEDMVWVTPFPFPGQLFRVDQVKALGGFRESSQYCGDWEMWAWLTERHGAARTGRTVAYNRGHAGVDRGSNVICQKGKLHALTFVQRKRILAMLRKQGSPLRFDRKGDLARSPLPSRMLLHYAASMSPRLLAYNVSLLRLSKAPHWNYALFQAGTRLLGTRFVNLASRVFRRCQRSD